MINLHLDCPRLKLTGRGVLTCCWTILRDQACDVHAKITPRGKEDESIDGLVEPATEIIGRENEEDAKQGQDGHDPLRNVQGIDLISIQDNFHGRQTLCNSDSSCVRDGGPNISLAVPQCEIGKAAHGLLWVKSPWRWFEKTSLDHVGKRCEWQGSRRQKQRVMFVQVDRELKDRAIRNKIIKSLTVEELSHLTRVVMPKLFTFVDCRHPCNPPMLRRHIRD